MRALLDINVLIALLDGAHADHARAWRWFDAHAANGWASCAITQNGYLRIVSQPGYPNPTSLPEAFLRLRRATSTPWHAYWPSDTSLLDNARFDESRLHGPRQLTDAYLLGLAVAHGGRFATFDQRIALSAVRGADREHLVVI
jgi:toxin-antitoxin system PIN domain toxin